MGEWDGDDRRAYVSKWLRYDELIPQLRAGDVVEFRRTSRSSSPSCTGVGIYLHYGVYEGCEVDQHSPQSSIIHFSPPSTTTGSDNASAVEEPSSSSTEDARLPEEPYRRKWRLRLPSLKQLKSQLEICRASIEDVAKDSYCRINNSMDNKIAPLDTEEILRRARDQLGSGNYFICTNNCEHFSRWCRYGKKVSKQVLFYGFCLLVIIVIIIVVVVTVICVVKFSSFLASAAFSAIF